MAVDPWIMIPFESGARRVNRDRLATALLLRMDHPTEAAVVARRLQEEFGIEKAEAFELTLATRYCLERGIEP